MGFAHLFIIWIMSCINSVSFSFLVNRSPDVLIKPSRGIRQGDPLSLYLFLIITEGLSNWIRQAVVQRELKGIRISNPGPMVTNLLFADDSMLFCKVEINQVQCIKRIISQYEAYSKQKINMEKFAIFFSKNTNEDCKKAICEILNGVTVQEHSKYLGLPLVLGRSKKSVFDFIRERVVKKMKNSKTKFQSNAGKEVMLKSVIQGLPVYTMSYFKLPKGCAKS